MNVVARPIRLHWSDPSPPNDECYYDHVEAMTPIGRFSIEWKSWKPHDAFMVYIWGEEVIGAGLSLDDAKVLAQEHFNKTVLACTENGDKP